MRRAWLIPVGGAVLAPLVTWWPMLAYRFPWLGLPRYENAAQGIDLWSGQTFLLASLALLAVVIAPKDLYLGGAVALAGLMIFWRGAFLDPTHSVMFAFGAAMLYAMRRAPREWHPRITSMLVALGVFQLLYVLQQIAGYDLFWGSAFGGQLITHSDVCVAWRGIPEPAQTAVAWNELLASTAASAKASGIAINLPTSPLGCSELKTIGTIGTVDAASAYIAVLAPLMPWWVLPVVFFAIWKMHSVGATLALAVGLFVKFWLRAARTRDRVLAVSAGAAAVVLAYYSAFAKSWNPIMQHVTGRGAIWTFAATDWLRYDPLVGYGLGGWQARIPALQIQHKFAPTPELWREAHNDYLQWIVELGVIGLILMALWLWTHRAMFAHPVYGGSLAALGVNAFTFFPLHVVPLSFVAIILVGLATAPPVAGADHPSPPPEWGSEQGE